MQINLPIKDYYNINKILYVTLDGKEKIHEKESIKYQVVGLNQQSIRTKIADMRLYMQPEMIYKIDLTFHQYG